MRKLVVALILLIVLGGVAAFVVYRFTRKPLPTPVGWKAYVTNVDGDGSPLDLSDPFGVAVGADGSIYMTDAGEHNYIQRIAPDGSITRIAGGPEGSGDGVFDKALFNSPSGLAVAPNGDLILAEGMIAVGVDSGEAGVDLLEEIGLVHGLRRGSRSGGWSGRCRRWPGRREGERRSGCSHRSAEEKCPDHELVSLDEPGGASPV